MPRTLARFPRTIPRDPTPAHPTLDPARTRGPRGRRPAGSTAVRDRAGDGTPGNHAGDACAVWGDRGVSDEPRLTYRVPEVAKMLGVSKSLAYEWVASGYLP